jgi:hypothetical protein
MIVCGGGSAQRDTACHRRKGKNPTWSWVSGEIVTDEAVLTAAPETPAGSYELRVGLYDAAAGGAWVPARDNRGRPLPDAQIVLTKLDVVQ